MVAHVLLLIEKQEPPNARHGAPLAEDDNIFDECLACHFGAVAVTVSVHAFDNEVVLIRLILTELVENLTQCVVVGAVGVLVLNKALP